MRDLARGMSMSYAEHEHRTGRRRVRGRGGAAARLVAGKGERCWRTVSLAAALLLLLFPPSQHRAAASVLRQIQVQHDGISLENVTAVAVSPDGKHVYAAQESRNHHSVTVLARDAVTGVLTYVETHSHWAEDDPVAFPSVTFITVAPDGRNVYVSDHAANALGIFLRDALTGSLTLVDVMRLDGSWDVTVSGDGAHVYVIGFAGMLAFGRDPSTGTLALIATYEGQDSVTVSPDGAHVLTFGRNCGEIIVYSRVAATGALSRVEAASTSLVAEPCGSVLVSPDGKHVYANDWNGQLDIFGRDQLTGHLSFLDQIVSVHRPSNMLGENNAALSPDGATLLVYNPPTSELFEYHRDAASGALTLVQTHHDGNAGVDGLAGVFAAAVSPDNRHVYAAGAADNALAVFNRDAATGSLSFLQPFRDPDDGLNYVTSMVISPDGAHLYAAAKRDNALTTFAIDAGSGALTRVQTLFDDVAGVHGLRNATEVAVSPDGADVYVAGDEKLGVFRRNPATGTLAFVETDAAAFSPTWVGISPDGAYVYAFDQAAPNATCSVLARNAATGSLTLVSNFTGGLQYKLSGTITPDGRYFYVAATGPGYGIETYSRNLTTGALSLIDTYTDALQYTRWEPAALKVAVTADGAHLLVAADLNIYNDYADGFMVVLRRDPSTGALQRESLKEPRATSILGLGNPSSIAPSADGRHVYVAAYSAQTLTAFDRDPTNGTLIYDQSALNYPVNDDRRVSNPLSVVTSADGTHVYVGSACEEDDRCVHFREVTVWAQSSLCAAVPRAGCLQAKRSTLGWRSLSDPQRVVAYTWLRGEDTLSAALGDPAALNDPFNPSSSYALCLYDSPAGGARLLLAAHTPLVGKCRNRLHYRVSSGPFGSHGPLWGPCWKQTSKPSAPARLTYSDRYRNPDGLASITLKAGASEKSELRVKGAGPNLSAVPALPWTPPVVVQVVNSDGECWDTTFTSDTITANQAPGVGSGGFKASVKRP